MPKPITIGPDLVGLVVTHGTATVIRPLVSPSDIYLHFGVANLHQHVAGACGTNYAAGIRAGCDLLEKVPVGYGRHIWLVADGRDNVDENKVDAQIQRARQLGIRIFTIPIGSAQTGHDCLYQIAKRTGGKLKSVSKLKELADTFERLAAKGGQDLGRGVAKVLLVDVSPSMGEDWDQTTKIEAAKIATIRWLQIEQKRQ